MPVVGDPETMNDTYVEQISAAARAAIETLDKKGVIDPKRVGVGGHSYGAFMTANLLAHTDLFAAGIARSGAYNRSLTPFGFQTERRSYWEATDLYTKMSPFTYAHKINEPILLIHGEADNNSGTFPIQSERLFQAIKGNGGTARLVLLPHESHGYRARESVLHVLAEMFEWADRYVKNRPESAGSLTPRLVDRLSGGKGTGNHCQPRGSIGRHRGNRRETTQSPDDRRRGDSIMKVVPLEGTTMTVPELVELARGEPVILTRDGQPLISVRELSGSDWESASLINNPRFTASSNGRAALTGTREESASGNCVRNLP